MGDPRKSHKKYKGPEHPWRRTRLEEEKILVKEYGFKSKREIWKHLTELRRAQGQAKLLLRDRGLPQATKEQEQLLIRLAKFGILAVGSQLEDVLALDVRSFLDRRLQTQVFKQGLAFSATQARQFIVHGHITVNAQVVTIPSFFLSQGDEFKLAYHLRSAYNEADHPERVKERHKKKDSEVVVEQPEEKKELAILEKVEKEVGLAVTE